MTRVIKSVPKDDVEIPLTKEETETVFKLVEKEIEGVLQRQIKSLEELLDVYGRLMRPGHRDLLEKALTAVGVCVDYNPIPF